MNAAFGPLRHPYEVPPEPGQAIELAEGVIWLRMPLPMVLDHVNVYALDDGDGWTVIDTGFDSRKTRAIWRDVLDGPLQGKPVKRVLVTHHHPDHIGLAGWFQGELGAELVTTRTAWLMARMLVLDEQPKVAPETVAFWRAAAWMGRFWRTVCARDRSISPKWWRRCPWGIGGSRMAIRSTSAGGAGIFAWAMAMRRNTRTLWADDDSLVIGGDQYWRQSRPISVYMRPSPRRTLWRNGWEACERLKPFARDSQLVLPGHKMPFLAAGADAAVDRKPPRGAAAVESAFARTPYCG